MGSFWPGAWLTHHRTWIQRKERFAFGSHTDSSGARMQHGHAQTHKRESASRPCGSAMTHTLDGEVL